MQKPDQPTLHADGYDCDSAQLDIAEAIDIGLSQIQRTDLAEHLSRCEECRATAAGVGIFDRGAASFIPTRVEQVLDLIQREGASYDSGGMLVQDESVPTFKLFVGTPNHS